MDLVNLHTHSQWSDGLLPASEVMLRAVQRSSLHALALTDHDTLSGIEPFFRTAEELGKMGVKTPFPVPGIELSLYEPNLEASIHMVGLFPLASFNNLSGVLEKAWRVLEPHCQKVCENRGKRDMEGRLAKAYAMNLEGLQENFSSLQEAKDVVIKGLSKRREKLAIADHKENDFIKTPALATYQDLITAWPLLVPGSNQERISLYLLRPHSGRLNRLSDLFVIQDGLTKQKALLKAGKLQGCLAMLSLDPEILPSPIEGLELLHQAGAISVLAHPAIENHRFPLSEYDAYVTDPLIQAGLNALEVSYPYDPLYKKKAIRHYQKMAKNRGVMVSGGTDYHGDGRSGIDDEALTKDRVSQLLNKLNLA